MRWHVALGVPLTLLVGACSPGSSTPSPPASTTPSVSAAVGIISQVTSLSPEALTAGPTVRRPLGRVILPHAPAQQAFSASCEAAAAALALRVAGHPVSETDVIAAVSADSRPPELSGGAVVRWGNPWKVFVGHQDGWWPWSRYDRGHPTGYGVYAPPMLDAIHRLGAPTAHGGTGVSLAELREAIRAGHPALVWLPSRHDVERVANALATGTWTAWDGTPVTYALHEHTQTLLGTDDGGFFVGTPDYQWTPGYPFLSYWPDEEFARAFAFLNNMAIILE